MLKSQTWQKIVCRILAVETYRMFAIYFKFNTSFKKFTISFDYCFLFVYLFFCFCLLNCHGIYSKCFNVKQLTFKNKSIKVFQIFFGSLKRRKITGSQNNPSPQFLLKLTFYQLKMIVKRKNSNKIQTGVNLSKTTSNITFIHFINA